ncbi:PREDICTED: elongator complex protein 5 [Fragaria vesca subsp. vesca]|uniref:elongator complex protein 5 n=1 Tax=Fragaria vesca subsp. vesca TaxID=101020 RepID=UPI0002C37359|nr:PREDICTED: elongator complex protein 5 [Fragaria vesca subsp. vesca]XP_011462619.1 PREDICTED: elongator complex protein 5 [Fragaria vesca subsp. vesca]XP_011462620.1 PREDICTED: elongator complex protein 5 [Fragaria vesca subsp. vesca]
MAAEWICRAVRDGALEGEHAPALTIKDTMASPLGFHVFTHFLSQQSTNISAAKSQSRGLVLVALSRSPSFYLDLLSNKGLDTASLSNKIRILDCYSDPLGWRAHHLSDDIAGISGNVKDVDALFSSVISLGTGLVGQGKDRFCVAIDSVNEMLRYASLSSVSGLISSLRCCGQISSIFWLCHADLCEERVTSALEYMSSMVASIEPLIQFANGQRSNSENLSLRDQSFTKGKLHLHCKRRNGRVRVMFEEIHIGQSGINFTSISSEGELINQGLVPKVQFSLQLSEKELKDRANVVLPFEHQGNGKPVQIYDGRKSLTDSKYEVLPVQNGNSDIDKESSKGEIIYFRDSEDEMPDSDEDPDDDLDI